MQTGHKPKWQTLPIGKNFIFSSGRIRTQPLYVKEILM